MRAHDPVSGLPWRGPGQGRPQALPLPPARMPLRFAGTTRKRWRYLGVFGEHVMLCAARVQVGPVGQTFWAVCERDSGQLWQRTALRRPGARGEVWTEASGRRMEWAPSGPCALRLEAKHPQAGSVEARLEIGAGRWVEAVCPNGAGGYVWTRKRVVPVAGELHLGTRRIALDAHAIEDESAGYHPRRTVWSWSAGVGTATDGRAIGWNLVAGVNDPPERSERAIWVEGEPFEPGPVQFDALERLRFGDGSRLTFSGECERRRSENLWLVRYSYRQPFGTFTGTLEGGIELERGLGVMEHHDALW